MLATQPCKTENYLLAHNQARLATQPCKPPRPTAHAWLRRHMLSRKRWTQIYKNSTTFIAAYPHERSQGQLVSWH